MKGKTKKMEWEGKGKEGKGEWRKGKDKVESGTCRT